MVCPTPKNPADAHASTVQLVFANRIFVFAVSFSKFRQIDDVKEKLLFFLLRNSKELLQTSGCPIIQVRLHCI